MVHLFILMWYRLHSVLLNPSLYIETQVFQREVIHQESYVNLTLSIIHRDIPCLQSEISYIIDIPTIHGKFCPQKAKELGIPSVYCFTSV